MTKEKSQIKDVLTYLQINKSITSMEAWEKFHITRLSAIIFRLRKMGYTIITNIIIGNNEYGSYHYGEYVLIQEKKDAVVSD